jgi:hypothetical protein
MRTRSCVNQISLVALIGVCCWGCNVTSGSPGSGGASASDGAMGSGGSSGSGGSTTSTMCTGPGTPPASAPSGATKRPCDIYADDGGPCVAAHSTVRALYASYSGPLYQVKKTDGSVMDINALAPGDFASSADQDTFCGVDACTISIIYDQSGKGNHLTKSPPGMAKMTANSEANAKAVSATFSGHKVYGVHIVSGVGYRNNTPCGTAIGDNAETEYMVVAGAVYNSGCCFDYGNMETSSRDDGEGTMEAVYFGSCTVWNKGGGDGPWVMGDLEQGLWAGDSSPYTPNGPVTYDYITAMVKGDDAGKNHWTIKIGDAQSGNLTPAFDGSRPTSRYNPMRKEGAVGLGTGGDNSSAAKGDFFEGVMTAAYSSKMADDDVQADIVSVYGQ